VAEHLPPTEAAPVPTVVGASRNGGGLVGGEDAGAIWSRLDRWYWFPVAMSGDRLGGWRSAPQ
jgi:hypothetical protein